MPAIVRTIQGLRAVATEWRRTGETIGFVPTMGALHAGHLSLVAQAAARATRVIVSIFVNPLQFGPKEDFGKYPRQVEADRALLSGSGCDLLYVPSAEEIYPPGFETTVIPGSLAQLLEGQHRPGHFAGVVTVVTKLLLQTLPDYAFFGEKDYQQLQLIKRTTRDLDLPVEIVPVPTLRDADGLALSSRNAYLSPEERAKAPMLHATLTEIAEHAKTGAPVEPILTQGHERLTLAGFQIDYLAFCDADTLTPLPKTNGNARILVAARLGTTRLIDNKAV